MKPAQSLFCHRGKAPACPPPQGVGAFRWKPSIGACAALLALSILLGCVSGNRVLASYPGAEAQIRAFYDANALERNATCTTPFISNIVKADPVIDNERQLVLDVDYLYDARVRIADYGLAACRNFESRRFTFDKVDGGLRLTGMTGEQRRRAPA
jgi:hypothetical protein